MVAALDRERLPVPNVDDDVALGIMVVDAIGQSPHPTQLLTPVRNTGVQEAHRRKVGQTGILVSTAVHDGHVPVLVEPLEPDERRMEAEPIRDLDDVALRDAQIRANAIVLVIAERHDGVETIVTAGQLYHHEDSFGMGLHARAL